ncbi:MAG: response regulator [Alphaproteobacteria bacterium]|nr:response regulator [Alphaproteobacteria bacterium]
MSAKFDPDSKLNLSKITILALESSQHSVDILAQILKGFGVNEVLRCTTEEEAEKALRAREVDLILIDPSLKEGDGYDFLRRLRREGMGVNKTTPVILLTGHAQASNVARAHDSGANFFVAKPITPNVLWDRFLWVVRDKRPFVELEKYMGPDRRFKFEGPPPGSDGRRASDLDVELGDAAAPNMSQDEINTFIKPQKVSL